MKVEKEGAITQRMESVLDELQDEFAAVPVYDRKAFERKMDEVKRAGTKSERPSKLRALFDMFERCGIPYEKNRENAYYEELIRTSDIPTFSELEDRMVGALFARYEKYPSPREYMERLVDRLSSPEDGWQNDTLRLRILKQFLKYGDFSTVVGIGGRRTIVNYVKEKRIALWQKTLEPELRGQKAQETEIQKNGMTSEKASLKKNSQTKETQRKMPSSTPTLEEILDLVDDGVFYCLPTAKKEDRKPGGKYGLLKIADDLAYGKFRSEGATRKTLYQFAMVYGMTYYSGNEEREEYRDEATDIEKNLFQDYYSNNLMRYITAAYRGNLSEFEGNPSGQGINYKNFAEVIYLYFIAGKHTRPEKMRLSAEMIDRVKAKQLGSGEKGLEEREKRTLLYREMAGRASKDRKNRFLGRDIFAMSEEEFEAFICENYDCDTADANQKAANGARSGKERIQTRGFMQMETEQFTAARVYTELLKKIPDTGLRQNYGLWYTDIDAFGKEDLETYRDRFPGADPEKLAEFLELLRAVSNFVKILPEPSPQTVTRTAIITAYYYYYNAVHEADGPDKWKNFRELYTDFKRGVDEKLEEAYYQPLSGKNIFDVLVVFSSFAYMNI